MRTVLRFFRPWAQKKQIKKQSLAKQCTTLQSQEKQQPRAGRERSPCLELFKGTWPPSLEWLGPGIESPAPLERLPSLGYASFAQSRPIACLPVHRTTVSPVLHSLAPQLHLMCAMLSVNTKRKQSEAKQNVAVVPSSLPPCKSSETALHCLRIWVSWVFPRTTATVANRDSEM